jgi:hypothetical protein
MIRVMPEEPATPELKAAAATESDLEEIQAKLRRLAEQLATREKLHRGESPDSGESAKPPR